MYTSFKLILLMVVLFSFILLSWALVKILLPSTKPFAPPSKRIIIDGNIIDLKVERDKVVTQIAILRKNNFDLRSKQKGPGQYITTGQLTAVREPDALKKMYWKDAPILEGKPPMDESWYKQAIKSNDKTIDQLIKKYATLQTQINLRANEDDVRMVYIYGDNNEVKSVYGGNIGLSPQDFNNLRI